MSLTTGTMYRIWNTLLRFFDVYYQTDGRYVVKVYVNFNAETRVPKVCGDCLFYFNPYDVDDMSGVVTVVLKDETAIQEKNQKLESQLSNFSWENNAKATLKI
mgnify:CR=1 FL=1